MEQVDNIIVVWASVKIGRRREALGYVEAAGQAITCAKEELPKMAVETSVLAMDQASASCATLQPSSFARSCSLPAHYNSTTPIHATP